jgi:hypothetical protein
MPANTITIKMVRKQSMDDSWRKLQMVTNSKILALLHQTVILKLQHKQLERTRMIMVLWQHFQDQV